VGKSRAAGLGLKLGKEAFNCYLLKLDFVMFALKLLGANRVGQADAFSASHAWLTFFCKLAV